MCRARLDDERCFPTYELESFGDTAESRVINVIAQVGACNGAVATFFFDRYLDCLQTGGYVMSGRPDLFVGYLRQAESTMLHFLEWLSRRSQTQKVYVVYVEQGRNYDDRQQQVVDRVFVRLKPFYDFVIVK